ncbi:aminotransferase class V-fold PLP-dependent enzyme [Actinomadura xylanilytica]|uniref:aminotransferase class V-fold PLP-dependent enzyme n=1 Tax=Actinomadura xylanilytica TaxID=887459 RepID=UPI00255AF0BB|nr:aminotransferase class V-fold PLP-dependent enzyme [Actinomadura xylanilytica]MDL4773321.1 aminotransferase class V-fold PLP-dependent enzyme [Actinomadura xylanilytica]
MTSTRDVSHDEFLLDPGIVMLNHASYGVTTRRVTTAAEAIRREIEADPIRRLGAELTPHLRARSDAFAVALGLDPAVVTFCANATSGAAAVIDSVEVPENASVVVLDTEYSSIARAWELKCARSGAAFIRVPVPVPLRDTTSLIAALESAVPGDVAYLQMSVVSSSAALWLPVGEAAAWARERGGHVILDAAHGPGHVPLAPDAWGAAAMFGTVHKWYPTLRPVGLLWLGGMPADQVRPAEVSLTWDSADLVERFSWPGTFDPVPRLGAGTALDQWRGWESSGCLDDCRALADLAGDLLTGIGGIPTGAPEFSPPRLRAFILPGTSAALVKPALLESGIRAWAGRGPAGECLVRVSTHVYNEPADIEVLVARLREIIEG